MSFRQAEKVEPLVSSRRPLVLHITGDYPDPSRFPTTLAVKRLIDSLVDCDHVVFSLTRTPRPTERAVAEHPAAANQRLVSYHHIGLPFGVGLFASFWAVARRIEAFLAANGLEPDAVHSHRLTFDGIAGWLIAQRRCIPHAISVRGEVESKVLRFKPTYRPLIRRILNDAHRIYYVSAWFRPELERLGGDLSPKSALLPNIVANTCRSITPARPRPVIIAAAALDILEKKGLDRLVAAFARAAPRLGDVRLEIVGTGRPDSIERMRDIVQKSGVADRITLRGAVPNAQFLSELPQALALALPSRNETFGMVYTEALFAGVPILYSRLTGIDGHLDGLDVGVGVSSEDIAEIADGLVRLVRDNAHYRAAIATAAPELYRRFNQETQVAAYMRDLADGLAQASRTDGAERASEGVSPVAHERIGGIAGVE